MKIETRELIAPVDAARMLGVCKRRLNYIAVGGRLPAIVDSSGNRTYRIEDLEKELQRRQAKKVQK
jgi:hypothetical protein